MANDSADAGADAVALAIRDLTEEVRCIRHLISGLSWQLLSITREEMTPETLAEIQAALTDISFRP